MPGLGGKGVALGVCAALSGVLFIAGIALTFSLPSIFNTMVRSGIPVDSVNHVNYPVFSDHGGQVPITMSFSFWNLTNPTDFQNGAKPKLVLVGPYVYREFLWRENISFSADRTSVSFTYHNPFVFVPERSGARQETDNITTVNIVFAGAIATIDSIGNKFQRELFVNAVNLTTAPNDDDPLNPQPATYMYQTRTVAELLFGYQDALLTVLAGAAAMNNRTLPDTVALSSRDQPLFFSAPSSMLTGVSDPAQTQVFTSWAGQKALNLWGTPWANMINGTDAWQFRPGVSCSDTLEVFVDALFRSVPFVCDPASKWPRSYAGLDVHPFGIDDSVFSPDKAFYNYGPKGVANLSIAVPGPVFVSRPYFLGADPYYRSLLDSFPEPSPDKDTVVFVEPVTGSSLAARKFIQVNVLVKPYKDILMASRLNTSYFPVLMLDELTLSPKGLTDLLKSQVFTPMSTAHSVCYAMIGLGAALVVICIGVLVYLKRKHDEYDGSVNRPLIQPGMRGL